MEYETRSSFDLLSASATAKYLQIAPDTLKVWRGHGRQKQNLPFCKAGRKVWYRWDDIQEFLNQHRVA